MTLVNTREIFAGNPVKIDNAFADNGWAGKKAQLAASPFGWAPGLLLYPCSTMNEYHPQSQIHAEAKLEDPLLKTNDADLAKKKTKIELHINRSRVNFKLA